MPTYWEQAKSVNVVYDAAKVRQGMASLPERSEKEVFWQVEEKKEWCKSAGDGAAACFTGAPTKYVVGLKNGAWALKAQFHGPGYVYELPPANILGLRDVERNWQWVWLGLGLSIASGVAWLLFLRHSSEVEAGVMSPAKTAGSRSPSWS